MFAVPTPTPAALYISHEPSDEATARAAYYRWLNDHRNVVIPISADLEDKAYYLAGEAPRLHPANDWPQWHGLRYAVGPASGEWGVYWPGCNTCPTDASCYTLSSVPRKSMATASYPGLQQAPQMGAAVAVRGGQRYLAVVWPGSCPTPQPIPTPRHSDPDGPGQ